MARCVYCDRPAGFLRKQHAQCQERHSRALQMIPELFTKALHSSLPAARFREMLTEAAGASFIKRQDLDTLCVAGLSGAVDRILEDRLPTLAEEKRIGEIKESLGPGVTGEPRLAEKLVKVGMLGELSRGQIPDRVSVVGPMPIELRHHECIVWIFNYVVSFRRRAAATHDGKSRAVTLSATETDLYCGLHSFADDPTPIDGLVEEATGDLVVTNRNIYFIFGAGRRRIPMAKVAGLQPHADGIQVTCEQPQGRSRFFKLQDPWLAANLITRLAILAQK